MRASLSRTQSRCKRLGTVTGAGSSCRGGTQNIGQRVKSGYAGQIVTIEVNDTTLRVYDQREYLIKAVPRTSRKELTRHKAYGHSTNRKTS
jgi:hypothetical protein